VDANTNCYFTAYFNGSQELVGPPMFIVTDPNPYTSPYTFTGNQLYDYLIGSLDQNGSPRWLTHGGNNGVTSDNESRGLAVSPVSGNVIVTGLLLGQSEFGAEGQNILLNEYSSLTGAGPVLYPLYPTPPPGTLEGIASAPTFPQVNAGWGVAMDANGCIYATGGFNDAGTNGPSLTFPYFFFPNYGRVKTPAGDLESVFVVKYCPSCLTNYTGLESNDFYIVSVASITNNILVTWQTFGGTTNVVQVTNGKANGSYTNNFTNLGPQIITTGTGLTTTNYLDVGGATNKPARYYRVELLQ
jgi:hypothetical protein